MVDLITAYSILNKSVLNVLNDLVPLTTVDFDNNVYTRLEEVEPDVTESRQRLNNAVVVAHKLDQYVNKFYIIKLEEANAAAIDLLINVDMSQINLEEFWSVEDDITSS